jgi:DNA-binding phage protein
MLALRPDAQPRFDTIQRVMAALGVKLTAVPA